MLLLPVTDRARLKLTALGPFSFFRSGTRESEPPFSGFQPSPLLRRSPDPFTREFLGVLLAELLPRPVTGPFHSAKQACLSLRWWLSRECVEVQRVMRED